MIVLVDIMVVCRVSEIDEKKKIKQNRELRRLSLRCVTNDSSFCPSIKSTNQRPSSSHIYTYICLYILCIINLLDLIKHYLHLQIVLTY